MTKHVTVAVPNVAFPNCYILPDLRLSRDLGRRYFLAERPSLLMFQSPMFQPFDRLEVQSLVSSVERCVGRC